ncbi:T9SS type A sorting domain-containing protein [Marinoscillum furvescens]|uniref:Putative secreted protein (Por secretion system target) n=1 Tax=Marinoscillum furvescens DSM 4134 TaxID=1122208 RepID=A0A3D9KYZ4_MARFU|nr:T9SS type A sorting domain-containing protein [Marinoscillum furvescens]RED95269.1 putative secreted protein (Por secretion system target) [Marinoscillum furvescens DSM 4134]
MTHKLFILACLLVASLGLLAQETIIDLDFDVQKSDISIADFDGDGNRDILIIGENPNGRFAQLFSNKGELTFEKVESIYEATWVPSVAFGDVNADGIFDVIQSGFADSVIVNLYTSNGAEGRTLDAAYSSLIHIAPGLGIADLNNDGYTDIFVFGNHNISDLRPKIYYGNAAGGFDETSPFDELKFIDSKPQAVDYDSDGDLDLWVMAGYEENSDARFGMMYVNEEGTFTATDLGIIKKGPGSSDWGDFDGDGDLDLLIGGWGYVNSGEDTDMLYRIYENQEGTFTEKTTFQPFGAFSPGTSSRFADWDNDGDLDVIVTGWNPDANGQRVGFFINDGGSFTLADYSSTVPGVSESALEMGDLDNDGDLDLVVNGFSGNEWNGEGSAFGKNISVVIVNTVAQQNEAPQAPADLQASADGKDVTFSWSPASDDLSKSLTYNLFLVDSNSRFYYTPLADTVSGSLLIQQKGNVELNTSWQVKDLPYGEYQWGVQAIDHSFQGSLFTSGILNHQEGGAVLGAKASDVTIYPNPTSGTIHIRNLSGVRSMSIMTICGRRVKNIPALSGETQTQINLDPGVYIVQLFHQNGTQSSLRAIVK